MAKKIGLFILMTVILMVSIPVLAAEQTAPPSTAVETISLEKCLDLTWKNSKQLQQAAESIKIAQAGVQEVSGGFWPSVGYRYGYGAQLVGPDLSILPPSTKSQMEAMEGLNFCGSLSVTQPLYTGGKLTAALKLAQLKLASAREDQRKAKQQLSYNVKEAYYRFWLAEKILDVAQDSYNNMGLHYQRVSNLNKAGTASAFDLLQAKVQWDNQKPQVIKAKNGLALAKLNLVTLMGLEPSRDFKVEYDPATLQLPETVTLTLPTLLDEAYQKRPEIHQIQQLSEIATANQQLAKAGYLPAVALSLNYSLPASTQMTLGDSPSKTLILSANLSGLLFDGFATSARVTSAQENLNLAQMKENSLKDQIRLEAAQALQSLEESIETTFANQANIQLAQESIKQVQIRFTAGVATTSDITDSQLALEQILNGYYQGISSYLTGLAKLDLIAGKDID
jgi:outer membrane protein TolC